MSRYYGSQKWKRHGAILPFVGKILDGLEHGRPRQNVYVHKGEIVLTSDVDKALENRIGFICPDMGAFIGGKTNYYKLCSVHETIYQYCLEKELYIIVLHLRPTPNPIMFDPQEIKKDPDSGIAIRTTTKRTDEMRNFRTAIGTPLNWGIE